MSKRNYNIISWNVNGIRAVQKKGFLDWLDTESPDILFLQETKAQPEQLDGELVYPMGYHTYFHSASVKKGYSGVALYSKEEPLEVIKGMGIEKFDGEGRVIGAEYKDFVVFGVYFPNGKRDIDRLNYKLEFYNEFLKFVDGYKKKGKKVIFSGDVNTAHKEIDLSRPKENVKVSGFMPVERKWIDQVIEHGYIDTLREFHEEPEIYTWFDFKTRGRERNVGWRIDYFFIQEELKKHMTDAFTLQDVMGSDHIPVGIKLTF